MKHLSWGFLKFYLFGRLTDLLLCDFTSQSLNWKTNNLLLFLIAVLQSGGRKNPIPKSQADRMIRQSVAQANRQCPWNTVPRCKYRFSVIWPELGSYLLHVWWISQLHLQFLAEMLWFTFPPWLEVSRYVQGAGYTVGYCDFKKSCYRSYCELGVCLLACCHAC